MLLGCSNSTESSALDVELTTAELGLRIADERKIKVVVLFTDCYKIKQFLNQIFTSDSQRLIQKYTTLEDHAMIFCFLTKAWISQDG